MKNVFFKDLSFDLTREWALLRTKIKRFLSLNLNKLVTYEEDWDYIIISTFGYFIEQEEMVINYSRYICEKYNNTKKIIIYGELVWNSKKISSLPYIFACIKVNEEKQFEKIFWSKILFNTISSKSINHKEVINPEQDWMIWINLTQKLITPCSYQLKHNDDRISKSKDLKEILEEFKYVVNKGYYRILLMWDDVFWYGNDIWFTFDELFNKMCEIKWYYNIIIDYANISNVIKFFPKIKSNFSKIKYIFMPSKSLNNKFLEKFKLDYREENIVKIIKKMKENSDNIHIKNFLFYRIPWESFKDFEYNLKYINLYDMTFFWEYDNKFIDKDKIKKELLIEKLRKQYIWLYRGKKDFIDSFE